MITDKDLEELEKAFTHYSKRGAKCEESALQMALDELDHVKREDLTDADIKALWGVSENL